MLKVIIIDIGSKEFDFLTKTKRTRLENWKRVVVFYIDTSVVRCEDS